MTCSLSLTDQEREFLVAQVLGTIGAPGSGMAKMLAHELEIMLREKRTVLGAVLERTPETAIELMRLFDGAGAMTETELQVSVMRTLVRMVNGG